MFGKLHKLYPMPSVTFKNFCSQCHKCICNICYVSTRKNLVMCFGINKLSMYYHFYSIMKRQTLIKTNVKLDAKHKWNKSYS